MDLLAACALGMHTWCKRLASVVVSGLHSLGMLATACLTAYLALLALGVLRLQSCCVGGYEELSARLSSSGIGYFCRPKLAAVRFGLRVKLPKECSTVQLNARWKTGLQLLSLLVFFRVLPDAQWNGPVLQTALIASREETVTGRCNAFGFLRWHQAS